MRVLIEHIAFQPYTGKITGGTERFSHLAQHALRLVGHWADIVVPNDSVSCDHIRSPATSKLCGSPTLKRWYQFLAEASADYDAVLLNHPLNSPVPFSMPIEFLRKCAYINHNGSGAYVKSAMGMRLLGHLKLLRHVGGKTFYLSESNKAALEAQWSKLDIAEYCGSRYSEAGRRLTGGSTYLDKGLFDAWFDEAVCPDDLAAPQVGQGYVVSIGRADSEKRLMEAVAVSKKLGKHLIVFTTRAMDEYGRKVIRALENGGAEVFLDADHRDIMSVLAGADALVLSSRNETYCHAAMEAVAHGVPVMALEIPPAMRHFDEMTLRWGESFATTGLEERKAIQNLVLENYSLEALGHRLEKALRR